ncbi:hypothetical protein [Oceanobacillus massiliensis]|nr:hypothetical protein [Oceanobacillus massiliensis]
MNNKIAWLVLLIATLATITREAIFLVGSYSFFFALDVPLLMR